MGQYYKAIILKDKTDDNNDVIDFGFSPYDYENGAKLMEHSYIGNGFAEEVELALCGTQRRLVWAGDYADEEPQGENLYCLLDKKNYCTAHHNKDMRNAILKGCYVVNHDKKEFYKRPEHEEGAFKINPLPLLTCEGNGQGCGDYFSDVCSELVGTWARDTIEILIDGKTPDETYKEIHPDFYED